LNKGAGFIGCAGSKKQPSKPTSDRNTEKFFEFSHHRNLARNLTAGNRALVAADTPHQAAR
jgi:hypothetical protein